MLKAGKLRLEKKLKDVNKEKEELKQLIDEFVFKSQTPALELLKEKEKDLFYHNYRIISESLENCSEKLFLLSSALLEEAEKKNQLKIMPSTSMESLCNLRFEEEVIYNNNDRNSEIFTKENVQVFRTDDQLPSITGKESSESNVNSYNGNEHLLDSPNIWYHPNSVKEILPLEIMEVKANKICDDNVSLDESSTLINLQVDDHISPEEVYASSKFSEGDCENKSDHNECDVLTEFSHFTNSEEMDINCSTINDTSRKENELNEQLPLDKHFEKEQLESSHAETVSPSNEQNFTEELAQYCASQFCASSSSSSFFSVCTSPQKLSSASSLLSVSEDQQSSPSQLAVKEEKSENSSFASVRNSTPLNADTLGNSLSCCQSRRTSESVDSLDLLINDKCAGNFNKLTSSSDGLNSISDQTSCKQDKDALYGDSIHIDTDVNFVSKNNSSSCESECPETIHSSILLYHNKYTEKGDSNNFELDENKCNEIQIGGAAYLPCVKLRTSIKAIVCHVVSPSDFWIQPDIEQFHELTQVLVPLHQGGKDLLPHCNIVKDQVCLVPYETDGNYYRALITDVLSAGNDTESSVRVFYIDYGNSAVLPSSSVRSLPKGLSSFPAQAIHCFLCKVTSYEDTWSEKAIDAFRRAVLSPYLHAYIYPPNEDSIYPVNLTVKFLLQKEENSYDIAALLCCEKLARKCPITDQFSTKTDTSAHHNEHEIKQQSSSHTLDVVGSAERNSEENLRFEKNSSDSSETVVTVKEASHSVIPPNTGTRCNSSLNLDIHNSDEDTLLNKENTLLVSHVTESQESSFFLNDCHKITDDSDKFEKTSDMNVNEELKCLRIDCKSVNSNNLSSSCSVSAKDECAGILPPQQINISHAVLVLCSEIVSPGEFYVNIAEPNCVRFDNLHKEMDLFYSNNYKTVPISKRDIEIGSLWSCRFSEDDSWYRIRVLKIWDSDETQTLQTGITQPITKALVFFVDYGDKQIVNISELQPLDESFLKLPAFAICCSLAHLYPNSVESIDSSDGAVLWPENAINRFQEIVDSEKHLAARVILPDTKKSRHCITLNDATPVPVLLWIIQDDKDILANAVLASEGLAGTKIKEWLSDIQDAEEIKRENDQLSQWNPMEEVFFSERNSYGVDTDDPEIATVGHKSMDEKYVCRFFVNGHCWRKNCPYLHHQGSLTAEIKSYSTLSTLELPDVGSNVIVQLTSLYNPTHFYIIFPYGTSPLNQLNYDIDPYGNSMGEDSECLETLHNSINECYSKMPYSEDSTVALELGKIVVAKSEIFHQWCRARVVDVSDSDQPIELFFLDFGTCERVKRRFIRHIKPEFLFLPIQAVECFIPNLHPLGHKEGSQWNDEVIRMFQEFVENKILVAHILQKTEDDSLKAELFLIVRDRFISLSSHLVSVGVAHHDDLCYTEHAKES